MQEPDDSSGRSESTQYPDSIRRNLAKNLIIMLLHVGTIIIILQLAWSSSIKWVSAANIQEETLWLGVCLILLALGVFTGASFYRYLGRLKKGKMLKYFTSLDDFSDKMSRKQRVQSALLSMPGMLAVCIGMISFTLVLVLVSINLWKDLIISSKLAVGSILLLMLCADGYIVIRQLIVVHWVITGRTVVRLNQLRI